MTFTKNSGHDVATDMKVAAATFQRKKNTLTLITTEKHASQIILNNKKYMFLLM